jgi:hypothetical protein
MHIIEKQFWLSGEWIVKLVTIEDTLGMVDFVWAYKPFPPPPTNLIDKAMYYALLYRMKWSENTQGITEPLTPDARRNTLYLRVRESVNRGCREAVKGLEPSYKRTVAYSILMRCCYDAFHYGLSAELKAHYNQLLDNMVGTH